MTHTSRPGGTQGPPPSGWCSQPGRLQPVSVAHVGGQRWREGGMGESGSTAVLQHRESRLLSCPGTGGPGTISRGHGHPGKRPAVVPGAACVRGCTGHPPLRAAAGGQSAGGSQRGGWQPTSFCSISQARQCQRVSSCERAPTKEFCGAAHEGRLQSVSWLVGSALLRGPGDTPAGAGSSPVLLGTLGREKAVREPEFQSLFLMKYQAMSE